MKFSGRKRVYLGFLAAGFLFACIGFGFLFFSRPTYVSFKEVVSWSLGEESLRPGRRREIEVLLNRMPSPCDPQKSVMLCLKEELVCASFCESMAVAAVAAGKQGKSEAEIRGLMQHIASHWSPR